MIIFGARCFFNSLKDYYGIGILISGDLLIGNAIPRQVVPPQPAKHHGPPHLLLCKPDLLSSPAIARRKHSTDLLNKGSKNCFTCLYLHVIHLCVPVGYISVMDIYRM